MSPGNVQNLQTQDVSFGDSDGDDFGFKVTNTFASSAHDAAAIVQHREAASVNLKRAQLNILKAEEATRMNTQKARVDAQTSREDASRASDASRAPKFDASHPTHSDDWPGHAPTSHAEGSVPTNPAYTNQKHLVINQVLGNQTIGSVNYYHSSTAAPPTDCNSTTGVNTVSHLCHTWLTIRSYLK
jgi:hypothetical protein